jgi:hypothetical protein
MYQQYASGRDTRILVDDSDTGQVLTVSSILTILHIEPSAEGDILLCVPKVLIYRPMGFP